MRRLVLALVGAILLLTTFWSQSVWNGTGGDAGLGTSFEASADYTVNSHVSVNGFLGYIRGGDVVCRSFAGDRLTFGYVETILRF